MNIGVDGDPKTVGHFYGAPKNPNFRCIPVDHVVTMKEKHKAVAQVILVYIFLK